MPKFPVPVCEIWRGAFLESLHFGHAVVSEPNGHIVEAWGDPDFVALPRSAAKMIQALPLLTSGAADATGLSDTQLALACASHQGAPLHLAAVEQWLSDLGLSDDDLRCGSQPTRDKALRIKMSQLGQSPCQIHNACSGKHTGFLALNAYLGGAEDYNAPDHPVQTACLSAFEEVTGRPSSGFAIDGCSTPNHATTMAAMARAMAFFASAQDRSDRLSLAAARLTRAMITNPEMVAGKGRSCTELMRATSEPVVVKTGAEGYFIAILPERRLGIAVKAVDGATRAAECTITALLVRLGVLDAQHPAALKRMNTRIINWRGLETGFVRPAPGLLA